MIRPSYIFTSESVSEGHPDKVADRISDTVVDAFLKADPEARVACETLVTTNRIVLAGEVRATQPGNTKEQNQAFTDEIVAGLEPLVRGAIHVLADAPSSALVERFRAIGPVPVRRGDSPELVNTLTRAFPALKDAVTQTQQAMGRVVEALPSLDPTLQGAAKTTLGKMEHELRSLHTKVIHAAKKRDETLRRQFVRAQAQAFPHGHPQERTLGVIYFLNKYGPGVVELHKANSVKEQAH